MQSKHLDTLRIVGGSIEQRIKDQISRAAKIRAMEMKLKKADPGTTELPESKRNVRR